MNPIRLVQCLTAVFLLLFGNRLHAVEANHGRLVELVSRYSGAENGRMRLRLAIEKRLQNLPSSPHMAQTQRVGYLVPFWSDPLEHEILFDLGKDHDLKGMAIVPAALPTLEGLPMLRLDGLGGGFPKQFEVFACAGPEADSARELLASTGDEPLAEPGGLPLWFALNNRTARWLAVRFAIESNDEVRIGVLGEVMIFSEGRSLPLRPHATSFRTPPSRRALRASPDYREAVSMESLPTWGIQNLTDGHSILGPPLVPCAGEAYGFNSSSTQDASAIKWVQIDLGETTSIDNIVLFPTTRDIASFAPGFGFPVRFRVETSNDPSFNDSQLFFNSESEDFPNPGLNPVQLEKAGCEGRYVRLTASRLYQRFFDYALLLGEMQVWSSGRNVALDRPVAFLDTQITPRFRPEFLVDGLNGPYRLVDPADWLMGLSERRELLNDLKLLEQRSAAWKHSIALTLERVTYAGVPVLFLGAALAWVLLLRRQVARQAKLMGEHLKSQATIEERARISRDMHDSFGARLTQISLLQDMALSDPGLTSTAQDTLHSAAQGTLELAQAMDEIVWSLNPRHDFMPAMLRYLARVAREYLQPLGISCKQDLPIETPDLNVSSLARHAILNMVKECLQNVAKHARATEVVFIAQLDAVSLQLTILDNGTAPIETPSQDSQDAHDCHDGLLSLRERAAAFGGVFELRTNDSGRSALITLPLARIR